MDKLGAVNVHRRLAEEYINPNLQKACNILEWRQQYKEFRRKIAAISDLNNSKDLTSMDGMVMFMNSGGQTVQMRSNLLMSWHAIYFRVHK